ncbi:protein cholesin [Salarias fasciatus]|uniref:WKF domain-containing protein n=1 Tax=Salarias fasciatus TaxID=181472 RepID=A0A672FV59_SALFA|nr:uncharacterized protein C7orf50 homolog [Salarias fasciatus]
MAKDKSSKSHLNVPPKKKLKSQEAQIPVEETTDHKVRKKRKKIDIEEAPVQIPPVNTAEDDTKQKNGKKRRKKQKTEETQEAEVEISDPPSAPQEPDEAEEEDLSPEERRVLERKMKKILKKEEKKRLKEAGETPQRTEGTSASQQALDYLTCWADNRSAWRFQKTRQTWLLQHMFDCEKVPDEKFSILLQYLEGLRGGAKDTTVQKGLKLVEESGQAPEDTAVQQRAHRAREVIQLFS